MSAIHYIARAWQSHAAATVGYEVDGLFYPIAECSGFGRSSEEAERTAAQIAAALNAAAVPDDEWTALDTHYASEVAGIRALPKSVTWTELHKFADAVAARASSAIRAENARLRAKQRDIDVAREAFGREPETLTASHQRLKEALAELIACKELRFAWLTMRSDPYHIMQAEYMEAELDRREPAVWDAAVSALKDAP